MASTGLRIGVVGCGSTARAFAGRLRAIDGAVLVGCVDADPSAARSLADDASALGRAVPSFATHSELIRSAAPGALAIFTPRAMHYRPAMDALQSGCHLFVEAPLSTVAQEAVDVAGLARGRGLKVAVGHHFRLLPSLIQARAMLADGAIGRVRLVSATMARPSLVSEGVDDPVDPGIDLLDALLWTTGQPAESVAAIRSRDPSGVGPVTSASIALAGGAVVSLAISGALPAGPLFEITYHGESGRLRVSDTWLCHEWGDGQSAPIPLNRPTFDLVEDFVEAVRSDGPVCCPAEEAIDSVRLLEAIARSATIGQLVGLA